MQGWRMYLPLGLVMAICMAIYSVLPSTMSGVYASPDETAHAVMTEDIARYARVSRPDAQVFDFPWLHPRSWVSVGSTIVPVGFLGWSVFLVPWYWVFGPKGLPWVGALVLVSGMWPFFHLVRDRLGVDKRRASIGALLATIVAWTFPSFIVYGNRGLFPNGPLLVFFLWACWLLALLRKTELSSRLRLATWIAAAVCIALTLTIRPVELVWMFPWWVWLGWGLRPSKREVIYGLLVFLITILPATVLAAKAYGGWFIVGYWLHDRVIPPLVAFSPEVLVNSVEKEVSRLPYGFHPRHMWWNVWSFFFKRLWLWTIPTTALLVMGVYSFWRHHRAERLRVIIRDLLPFLLAAWTGLYLLVIYGSGLYTDHIRIGAIAIANSFLRYTLPVACMIGVAIGLWYVRATRDWMRVGAVVMTVIFVGGGIYQAGFADDEGIWRTRTELIRYAEIRETTIKNFESSAVIFSERSDKVSFPWRRAVSPMPSAVDMARLARLNIDVGLFARPLSQEQKDRWRQVGFDVQEVGSFGRERLYKLRIPSSP